MPRTAENANSLAADLASGLNRLVEAARKEGRDEALAELRHLVAGGTAPTPAKRGPGRPKGSKNTAPGDTPAKAPKAKRPGSARRNPWAEMTPAARLARVNAIRVGRGLAPKDRL